MKWAWAIEIGLLLVPIFILTCTIFFLYQACTDMGMLVFYEKFPPL